ncbi:MAG: hypothetical protein ACOX42_03255 [Clostridia bacterium]
MPERVKRFEKRIVELRRDFHMHPELAGQEVRTSGVVSEVLEGLGLKVERGYRRDRCGGATGGKGKWEKQ